MECPKCQSTKVERLPPSQISPRPGYRCKDCGIKLRAPGTYVVYLVLLLIGLSFLVGAGYALLEMEGGNRPIRVLWLGGTGLIVAGYSAMQLARPTARSTNEQFGDPTSQ